MFALGRVIYVLLFCLLMYGVRGQKSGSATLEIIKSRTYKSKIVEGRSVQYLVGDVQMRYKNTFFFSDVVIVMDTYVLAFPHVRILINDTLGIVCDTIRYDKVMNVVSSSGKTTLTSKTTEIMTRNSTVLLDSNVAIFPDSMEINFLASGERIKGSSGKFLFSEGKEIAIVHGAVLYGKDRQMKCDTMIYYMQTGRIDMRGNGVVTSPRDTAYFQDGIFDQRSKITTLKGDVRITGENSTVVGDSILLDRDSLIWVWHGVLTMWDTSRKTIVKADTIISQGKENMKTSPETYIQIQNLDGSGDIVIRGKGCSFYRDTGLCLGSTLTMDSIVMGGDTMHFVFYGDTGHIFLSGYPWTWKGKNGDTSILVRGDSIKTFFMRGEKFIMEVRGNGVLSYYDSTHTVIESSYIDIEGGGQQGEVITSRRGRLKSKSKKEELIMNFDILVATAEKIIVKGKVEGEVMTRDSHTHDTNGKSK